MPRQSAWLLAAALLAAGSCGCTSARYVTLEPNGGVVAIPDNSNSWPTHNRDKAEALMLQKSPQGYVIEREGEVVTGTTEHTETHTARTGDPMLAALHVAPVTEKVSQDTTHHDRTEWRIWFRAKDAPPAAGPAAPPALVPASLPAQPVPVAVGGDGR